MAAGPNANNDHREEMRSVAEQMYGILTQLYPESEPRSLEFVTYKDVNELFRLTGLGAPAMKMIEQIQRVNRSIGKFRQTGLCEFHIGIIYLYWGECGGAVQQFAEARQQWSFANETASVCLAHYAMGVAHCYAYRYESALSHFGKAEYLLPRVRYSLTTQNQDRFIRAMEEALAAAIKAVREKMQPEPEAEPGAGAEAGAGATAGPGAGAEARAGATARPDGTEQGVPPPHAGQRQASPAAEPVTPYGAQPAAAAPAPPPINNLSDDPEQPGSPILAHRKVHDSFSWYRVTTRREDDFLPDIRQDSWVLVDKRPLDETYQPGQHLVVFNNAEDVSIILRPHEPAPPFRRICLAQTPLVGGFRRDIGTGEVFLSSQMRIPVDLQEVIGVVVGFWWQPGFAAASGGGEEGEKGG